MPYQEGESGNLKGRPINNRPFTEILRLSGEDVVEFEGEALPGARVVAILLWRIATTGSVELPNSNGRRLLANTRVWFDIVKFIYNQIEGPPPSNANVNLGDADGNPIKILVGGIDPSVDI